MQMNGPFWCPDCETTIQSPESSSNVEIVFGEDGASITVPYAFNIMSRGEPDNREIFIGDGFLVKFYLADISESGGEKIPIEGDHWFIRKYLTSHKLCVWRVPVNPEINLKPAK